MRVGITADRRWDEQARMFAGRGFDVFHAPTMRTIDLSQSESLREATIALADQPPDYLVVSTGMGMRRWLEAAAPWGLHGPLMASLHGARVVARGAKANSAARGAGLDVWWRSPQETMQEIVDHLRATGVADARVAVQLFEPEGHPSTEALRSIVGELVEVPVYQWALPDDPGPARELVQETVGGLISAVTFTAQPAVHNLFRVAEDLGESDALRAAFNGSVVASGGGPVCASAASEEGIQAPLWPERPRLAAMVRQCVERLADC